MRIQIVVLFPFSHNSKCEYHLTPLLFQVVYMYVFDLLKCQVNINTEFRLWGPKHVICVRFHFGCFY